MDQAFLQILSSRGLTDFSCNRLVFGESDPSLSTPGEKEFLLLIQDVLSKYDDIVTYQHPHFPAEHVSFKEAMQMRTLFTAINVIKVMRSVGIPVGPTVVDALPFPFWRHKVWSVPKADKFFSFVGIPKLDHPDLEHPLDFARSTLFNGCVSIRETPDTDILHSEDYTLQHAHGLQGISSLLSMSFFEVDSKKRTFRMYCIQGCSRVYTWEELKTDARVQAAIKAKILVKGRIPRTKNFLLNLRTAWEEAAQGQVSIQAAQHRLLSRMPQLAPLLPIKMSPQDLAKHCRLDIAPLILSQFLDGRAGMSYGFLAYQLPSGPVDSCETIRVLCTRSGCDKQRPHPMDDWVVLSCDRKDIILEGSAALKGVTSPSFDSWLIVAQAAANVSLAKRFKDAGKCASYVDMVENQGLALCHFHGFIDHGALPANMAFFGQDRLPLPCGSVESAYLTVQEKRSIGDKVLTLPSDIDYLGDVHVEPDHGSVVSCPVEVLDRLTRPDVAAYGLSYYRTYKASQGETSFKSWAPKPEKL